MASISVTEVLAWALGFRFRFSIWHFDTRGSLPEFLRHFDSRSTAWHSMAWRQIATSHQSMQGTRCPDGHTRMHSIRFCQSSSRHLFLCIHSFVFNHLPFSFPFSFFTCFHPSKFVLARGRNSNGPSVWIGPKLGWVDGLREGSGCWWFEDLQMMKGRV